MTRIESQALVLRTVAVGEADVVATLVTESSGKLGVVARGARKSSRRMGGALEPVHTIEVLVEDTGRELGTLKEARVVRMRPRITSDLDALDAAGVALRWARHLFPPRTHEPEGWRVLIALLDGLDRDDGVDAKRELARAGLAMLSATGYGLELAQCVSCGRPCPEDRPAYVDPARGGVICRACGGAARIASAAMRATARSLVSGDDAGVGRREALDVLELIDLAMAAHTGFER